MYNIYPYQGVVSTSEESGSSSLPEPVEERFKVIYVKSQIKLYLLGNMSPIIKSNMPPNRSQNIFVCRA